MCIALISQVRCTLHTTTTVYVLGWLSMRWQVQQCLRSPSDIAPTQYRVTNWPVHIQHVRVCVCVFIDCLFNNSEARRNECVVQASLLRICLCWRSRRAPGRTGVWLARAAEICSFPLVNASLPLTLPRATASLSHNHSDTISSPLLIFFIGLVFSWLTVLLTLSFQRLTIQLKCLLNLCSYCTLFKLCPLSVGFLFLSTARVLLSPWACVHLSLCSPS